MTCQLTSCFNESEGKIQVNLLRVLMRVKVEDTGQLLLRVLMRVKVKDTGQLLLRVLMRVKVKDTGQLTSCFNESEGS